MSHKQKRNVLHVFTTSSNYREITPCFGQIIFVWQILGNLAGHSLELVLVLIVASVTYLAKV